MSRRAANVSIKQLAATATTETKPDGTTTITIPTTMAPVSTATDVSNVVNEMISNDKILDEDDVNSIVNNKLTDYATKHYYQIL